MKFLELVQSLHREAKLPGSPPPTVVEQNGRAGDLVRWTIEAWNDIQRERDGKWKWLRAGFTVDTVANTAGYAPTDCTDTEENEKISRFRGWYIDPTEPPLIHLVSDGFATQRELAWADWHAFRHRYRRGTHEGSYPAVISTDPADTLFLGPKPDGIYRVDGDYWRSNQALDKDDDVPEMPADYHMLIVYRAITKYAYAVVGHEILARAKAEGMPLFDALSLNQAYSRFQLRTAGALA